MSAPAGRVLAGDVGGTKTLLQVAEFSAGGGGPRVLAEGRFDSAAYDDLAAMAGEFLRHHRLSASRACFGVAGPVQGDAARQRSQLTNLPWRLDSQTLAESLGLSAVRLINDFQAVGYAIEALGDDDLAPLQEAPARPGAPRLALGAGTGLGVALLFPDDGRYEVYPTEGGHGDFAPIDDEQDGLLEFLRSEHGRVSHERVVSGPGLAAIYRFLLSHGEPDEGGLLDRPDPAAAIAQQAEARPGSAAGRALTLFVRAYGAVAGNLALTCLASGGVYIAGGIAPKLLARLRRGDFMAAFNDKGRMAPLTRAMPVRVITNPHAGLLGAAVAANRLQESKT